MNPGDGQPSRTDRLLWILMVVVLLLLLVTIGLFWRVNQMQREVTDALAPLRRPTPLAAGVPAPDFRLSTADGQTYTLQDSAGRQLLLVFSSVTCPPCQQMYPALAQLHARHPDVTVLLISRGSVEENRRLAADQGFTFPVVQWQDQTVRDYHVPGTPFFYLIDARGVIVGSSFVISDVERLMQTRTSQ